MAMPFGKYKGTALTELPQQYLDWILSGEFEGLRGPLRAKLEDEQRRRQGVGPSEQESVVSTETRQQQTVADFDEMKVRRIVRQELGSLFKRLGVALETGKG